jgi:hypothetical protein
MRPVRNTTARDQIVYEIWRSELGDVAVFFERERDLSNRRAGRPAAMTFMVAASSERRCSAGLRSEHACDDR